MTRKLGLSPAREHTGDRQTDQVWQALNALANRIANNPIADGRLITEEENAVPGTGLFFASGVERSIAHKLGRKAKGFIEVYSSDNPSALHVGLFSTPNAAYPSDSYITVTPTDTGACWIWVF